MTPMTEQEAGVTDSTYTIQWSTPTKEATLEQSVSASVKEEEEKE